MGKSLIIKGADFSENGMQVRETTLDKSDLYNYTSVLITSENFSSQTNSDHCYYYVKYADNTVVKGKNVGSSLFVNMFSVGDYTDLEVNICGVIGTVIPDTGCQASIIFTDINGEVIEAYINENSSQTGDIYKKIPSPFNSTIHIPEGAVTCYISDYLNSSQDLTVHKATLKKYVID